MKFAIIGFGGMGHHHYKNIIPRLNESDYKEKLEIAGIYDINNERNEFAKELGIHCFKNVEEIYNDKSIEIVLIATPNDVHLPYVIEALKHDKNVICEKPLGLSSNEVKKMYKEAKKANKIFEVHQNRRWDDDFLTIKNIYDKKTIGNIYQIESRVMGSNGIPGAWRRVFKQGGGMMLDWGVHLIDQMLNMINSKITYVYCTYSYQAKEEVDDGFNLQVKFENGLLYNIVVDTNCFNELPRWQLYGENGTATITNWHANKVEGKVTKVNLRTDDKLVGVEAGNGFTKTMAKRRNETIDEIPLEVIRGDKNAFYKNFMNAIINSEETLIKEEQVLRVFKVMEAAYTSAKKNKVIKTNI